MPVSPKVYSTSEIAGMFGLHPNTIRMYESWGVLSAPERSANRYRLFSDEHIKQIEIIGMALKTPVIQNGLRKQAIQILRTMALREYDRAIELTDVYQQSIKREMDFARQAIDIVSRTLADAGESASPNLYTRQQAADELDTTIDTLRNWEMNGLIRIKRKENGYRVYDESDMQKLTVIRQLRVANYSLSAILRMLNALRGNREIDLSAVLNTPDESDHIISVCDRLLVSLGSILHDTRIIKDKLSALQ